jgi:sulfite exporter TauE/SafE
MIYLTALALGIFSSMHCIGMCGPIALAIPIIKKNFATTLFSMLAYNIGRIISYSTLGLVAGAIGAGFYNSINQRWFSVSSGIIIILWVLIPVLNPENWKWLRGNMLFSSLRSSIGKLLKKKSVPAILFIGMLNGLLPCGMVYIALAAAIAVGGVFNGGVYMFFYGLGTLPLMLILGFSWQMITPRFKKRVSKLSPVLVAMVGLILILRGLELGIPILSPGFSPSSAGITTCHAIID